MNNLTELLENHQVTQRLCGGVVPPPGGGETRTERCGRTAGTQCFQALVPVSCRGPAHRTPGEDWRCFTRGQKGHLARHCPGGRDVSMSTASQSDRRRGACHCTTCWSHERTNTHALLDSGSVVTLIQPGLADGTPVLHVEVGCIHGQTETYPTHHRTNRKGDLHGPGRSRA